MVWRIVNAEATNAAPDASCEIRIFVPVQRFRFTHKLKAIVPNVVKCRYVVATKERVSGVVVDADVRRGCLESSRDVQIEHSISLNLGPCVG